MQLMLRTGRPITRENYIKVNWLGSTPKPWTAELEEELPPELQENLK